MLIQYGVKKDGNDKDLIDYDEVEQLAKEHKPKMIIAGASAYPRIIDWKKFRQISDDVGAHTLLLIWLIIQDLLQANNIQIQ